MSTTGDSPSPASAPPPSAAPGSPIQDDSRSGRTWLAVAIVAAVLLAAGALVYVLTSGDGETAAAPSASSLVPGSTTTDPGSDPPTSGTGSGTQDDPLALRETATVGDYEVAIIGFTGDATAEVLDHDELNEVPEAGSVYSLVRVRATYEGNAWLDITVGLVGDDGRTYADTGCSAVTPDDMLDEPEVLAGSTVEGTFCVVVPESQLPSGLVFVEPTLSLDEEAVWWRPS